MALSIRFFESVESTDSKNVTERPRISQNPFYSLWGTIWYKGGLHFTTEALSNEYLPEWFTTNIKI